MEAPVHCGGGGPLQAKKVMEAPVRYGCGGPPYKQKRVAPVHWHISSMPKSGTAASINAFIKEKHFFSNASPN